MKYIKNKYEAYRFSQHEKAERERIQRNKKHPHKPDCKQNQDIELFDKEYTFLDTGSFPGSLPVLEDYKTRCTECGACSNADHAQRRERKAEARTKYALERLHDVTQNRPLEPRLSGEVVAVVASAFGSAPGDTADHLRGDLMLIARDKKGETSGFASLDFVSPAKLFAQTSELESTGGYFAAAAVGEKHQKHGLYHLFAEERLNASLEKRVPYVFTRTQNPAIELAMKGELVLAQEEGKITGFRLERRYVPECYGQQLAKKQPKVRNLEVERAFSRLNTKAGDAYILIFHLEYARKESR
jgi:hypothetical protein